MDCMQIDGVCFVHDGLLNGGIIRFYVLYGNDQFTVHFDDPNLKTPITSKTLQQAVEITREHLYSFTAPLDVSDRIVADSLNYNALYDQQESAIIFDATCSRSFGELRAQMLALF